MPDTEIVETYFVRPALSTLDFYGILPLGTHVTSSWMPFSSFLFREILIFQVSDSNTCIVPGVSIYFFRGILSSLKAGTMP